MLLYLHVDCCKCKRNKINVSVAQKSVHTAIRASEGCCCCLCASGYSECVRLETCSKFRKRILQ